MQMHASLKNTFLKPTPAANMALRLSHIIRERGLKAVLVQARRGLRKAQSETCAKVRIS